MNVAEPLAHHARASAHKPAIVQGERVVTYGELDPLVRRTAAHLYSLGLGQGDVAGVALQDSIEHLVLLCGARARRDRHPAARLALDARGAGAGRDALRREAGPHGAGPAAAGRPALHCRGRGLGPRGGGRRQGRRRFPEGDVPLLMSLSSGTTGRPKGPRIRHSQFLARYPRVLDQPRLQQPGPLPLRDAALLRRRPHLRAPHAAIRAAPCSCCRRPTSRRSSARRSSSTASAPSSSCRR